MINIGAGPVGATAAGASTPGHGSLDASTPPSGPPPPAGSRPGPLPVGMWAPRSGRAKHRWNACVKRARKDIVGGDRHVKKGSPLHTKAKELFVGSDFDAEEDA